MQAFFSSQGRVRGSRLFAWFAVVALVFWLCFQLPYDQLGVALGLGAITALVLAKAAAESGRRLHDLGVSARIGAWAALGLGRAALLSFYFSLRDDRATLPITGLIGTALVLLVLWPGNAGPNRFGEPPPTSLLPAVAPPGRAAWLTPVLLLLVIEGGIISLAWLNDALRRTHEKQYGLSRRPQLVAQDNIFAAPSPEDGQ